MRLERKIPIGEKAFNVFADAEGKERRIEISLDDYASLGLERAKQPSMDGHEWRYAYKRLDFDTASGSLEDGQYADCGEHYAVKLEGAKEVAVAKSALSDGVLDDRLISEITSDGGNQIKVWR